MPKKQIDRVFVQDDAAVTPALSSSDLLLDTTTTTATEADTTRAQPSRTSDASSPAEPTRSHHDSSESHIHALNRLSPEQFAQAHLPPDLSLLRYAMPDNAGRAITSTSVAPAAAAVPSLPPSGREHATYMISLKASSTLDPLEFRACFDLIEQTSSAAYQASAAGWNPDLKQAEMKDDRMKYLLVRAETATTTTITTTAASTAAASTAAATTAAAAAATAIAPTNNDHQSTTTTPTTTHADPCDDDDPHDADRDPLRTNADESDHRSPVLGFLSFMIDIEDTWNDIIQPIIYVYEVHLTPSARGCGLGKHLMAIIDHLARSTRVEKTMLTVFSSNTLAESLYTSLGYQHDEISPREKRLRRGVVKKPDYWILSKRFRERVQDRLT